MGSRQQGAAIMIALVTVAVAAALVSGVVWRQAVMARQVENELSFAQATWLLRGTIDWVRVILAEDARTSAADHYGEPWAMQIADTRLNEDDGRAPAYLAGGLADAQAKYNLRNLATPQGVVPSELETLRRLLALVDLPETLAEPIAQRILLALAPAAAGPQSGLPRAIPLRTVDDLMSVDGVSREYLRRLEPYLTVLPMPTPVNANTAPAEVLAARLEGLSLPDARRLVESRDRAYFKDLQDLLSRLPRKALAANAQEVSTGTQFFLMEGRITYQRAQLHAQALLFREGARVDLVWVRDLS
jgi:general secretion pathway protein K